jgi:uncharacterized protein YejL (UPF0352 family)
MTAVQPTKSFGVGERSGPAVHEVAGWEWWSDWGDSDVEPLMAEMLRVLQPHEASFEAAASNGASVSLTVVGEVSADLITTEAEASAIGWDNGEGDAFRPFLVTTGPSSSWTERSLPSWSRLDARSKPTLTLISRSKVSRPPGMA